MKHMNRILAALLTLLMILSLVPINAPQANAANYASIKLNVPWYSMRHKSGCGISSVAMVEGFVKGYGENDTTCYNAVYNFNKAINPSSPVTLANYSKIGYSTISNSLEAVYDVLKSGMPVIVYRKGNNHYSVIYAYSGSTSKLEKSGFKVMDTCHPSNSYDTVSWSTAKSWGMDTNLEKWLSGNTWVHTLKRTADKITLASKKKITLTFDANGGTIHTNDNQQQASPYKWNVETGVLGGAFPTCTKEGSVFKGWFTKKDGGVLVRSDEKQTESRTLYARWDDPTYNENPKAFTSGKNYAIFSYASGMCLTASGVTNNDRVIQKPYDGAGRQVWTCSYSKNGVYSFYSKANENMALDIDKNSNKQYQSGNLLQVYTRNTKNTNQNQQFNFIYRTTVNGQKLYSIHCVCSGRALEIQSPTSQNGQNIMQAPYRSVDQYGEKIVAPEQLFYIEDADGLPSWENGMLKNVTENDAKVFRTVRFGKSVTFTECGIYLAKGNNELKKASKHDTLTKDNVSKSRDLDLTISSYAGKLEANTTYRYQIYVIANGKEYRSEIDSFTTSFSAAWSNYKNPILTENDARVEGEVRFSKSVTFTECGFYLAKGDAELKKVAKHDTVTTDKTGTYRWVGYTMSTYYGKLEAGTTYRYQFYVIANGQEYKSEVKSFTTPPKSDEPIPPSATWSNYKNPMLTENDARVEGEVRFSKTVTFTECGFYLAKGDAELKKVAKHDTVTTDKNSTYRWMGYTMSTYYGKLEAGTTYRYQFYVIADGHEYKSEVKSFTTEPGPEPPPTATWSNYKNPILTENDARVEGEVRFSKTVTFTECGFYLAKGDAELKKVAKHDTVTTDKNSTYRWMGYTMSTYYGKLEAGTTYRYQFYVIADGKEHKSEVKSFTTISIPGDTAPTKSEISFNSNRVLAGDDIRFTFSSDTATDYALTIFDDKGICVFSDYHAGATYSYKCETAGLFFASVSAYNNNGSKDSAVVYFQVVSDTPTKVNTIEANGHTYELYLAAITWEDAKKWCEDNGGHLITITNQEEQSVLEQLLDNHKNGRYWLGGQEIDDKYEWVTGEPWGFEKWNSGEPNHSVSDTDETEHYLGTNYNTQWNDFHNSVYNICGFVMEKNLSKTSKEDTPTPPKTDDIAATWSNYHTSILTENDARIEGEVSFNQSVTFTECGFYLAKGDAELKKVAKHNTVTTDMTGTFRWVGYTMSTYYGKLEANTAYRYQFYVIADGIEYKSDIQSLQIGIVVPDDLGDVDGNGEIESADARLALRASVKLEDIKEGTAAFRAADIDGNGAIESSDARHILRLSVQLENMEDLKAKYGK